jgi:hypothetical protein
VGDRARDIGQHQSGRPGSGRAEPSDDARRARYDAERDRAAARPRTESPAAAGADLGPGHEESGGYVDPEQHRY